MTTCEARGALTYVIQPFFIDYSETVEVKLAAYSCMESYLGTQAVFGLSFASDCWALQDSIVVPPCSIMVGCAVGDSNFIHLRDDELQILPVCDTCSHEFVISGILNQMSETVNTCSGIDTFDLTYNNLWLLSHMVSPMWAMAADSSDSIEMTVVGDTLTISSGLTVFENNVALDNARIELMNDSSKRRAEIYARNDTVFFTSGDTAGVTFKFGHESLYITDTTGEWGRECSVTGGYSFAFGDSNTVVGTHSTIAGGLSNEVLDSFAVIGGGWANVCSTKYGFIGSGRQNMVNGNYSVVCGGRENISNNFLNIIGGGYKNIASGEYSVIGGGTYNHAIGNYSSILGGDANVDSASYSTLIGKNNLLRATADHSYGIGENIDLSADSTIYLKNEYIVLDGALTVTDFDTLGAYLDSTTAIPDSAAVVGWGFLPFWMSGDTLYFEVGDSTWIFTRDGAIITP